MSTTTSTSELAFRTIAVRALAVAGVGVALCVLGVSLQTEQFFRSYLMAFLYWLGLSLGALGIWLLHNLTGGRWGVALRRLLEAATRVLPLLALLFLPLVFGLPWIYEWAKPEAANDPELAFKVQSYLRVDFFLVRAAIYFILWLGIAWLLNSWSAIQDKVNDWRVVRRMRDFSGPALGLLGLSVTFAAIDWIMSLTPKWYSTIFGALIGMGMLLPALALAIAAACWLAPRKPLADVLDADVWNDLGNMLLAFVVLWTYLAFSQYLLIWSGNLPEEITWYLARSQGGWEWIALALALFYFGFPFVFLLSRDVKRYPERLRWIALTVACASYLHQLWLIAPTYSPGQFPWEELWLDTATMLAVGGLWLTEFFRQLAARPLVPVHQPAPEEVLSHA